MMHSSMKIHVVLGLLTVLLPSVVSISCFVCSSSPTNEQCNLTNQTCPVALDLCLTIIDVLGNTQSIVKQCASQATCTGAISASGVDDNGNGNIVNCCNSTNFCNINGAGTIALRRILLALPLLLVPALVMQ